MEEIVKRVREEDPARGRWDVKDEDITVWTDASALAMGVVVEVNGDVVEDGSWLRRDDGVHINMAELDAALKGVNMAILWGASKFRLMTDSRTVYHWMTDLLSGRARLKTKAASEMLIRRRLSTLKMLVDEYQLSVDVQCVTSAENRADALTRVPDAWRQVLVKEETAACAVEGSDDDPDMLMKEVARIHHASGHPGVRRTLYFARRANKLTTRRVAQAVVSACQTCRSIDPAPEKWRRGQLDVETSWERVAIDVTHHGGRLYLTVVDCGPSRFAIWRPLRYENATYVVAELEAIFLERGPPSEILLDNATAFRGRVFRAFAKNWGVAVRYRAAHVPSGNGVVERNHRSVKVIAARAKCGVAEAVYRYNTTPKDDATGATTPASMVYRYDVRVRDVDPDPTARDDEQQDSRYHVGDAVWVKSPKGRCDDQYGRGVVTGEGSPQTVEVDGVPRHVRHLRPRADDSEQPICSDAADEEPCFVRYHVEQQDQEEGPEEVVADGLRRGARLRPATQLYRDPVPSDVLDTYV